MAGINTIIPSEILPNIFKNLQAKYLCSARSTCKLWKDMVAYYLKSVGGKFIQIRNVLQQKTKAKKVTYLYFSF